MKQMLDQIKQKFLEIWGGGIQGMEQIYSGLYSKTKKREG